jgi:hypothetical protein
VISTFVAHLLAYNLFRFWVHISEKLYALELIRHGCILCIKRRLSGLKDVCVYINYHLPRLPSDVELFWCIQNRSPPVELRRHRVSTHESFSTDGVNVQIRPQVHVFERLSALRLINPSQFCPLKKKVPRWFEMCGCCI